MRVRLSVLAVACCLLLQEGPALAQFDAATVQSTVDDLGAVVRREYMDPAVGERINTVLHARLAAGAYQDAGTPETLASRLTADLQSVAHDKHLAVIVIPPSPPGGTAGSAAAISRRESARRDNGGIRRVEVLRGNVGYLDMSYFWHLDEGTRQVADAMRLLANADALIVDMRNNSGGSPEMVAYVMSYFFEGGRMPLFDITPRYGRPSRYFTSRVPRPDGRRPMYVLTAAHSFSGAEGLAFLLQDRGRAEVVGEVTAGAANPGKPYPVNQWFEAVVPNGRLLSVPSGRNWEGTGVTPDVPVPAADACRVAHERALVRLRAR